MPVQNIPSILTVNCGSSSLKFSLYEAGSLQMQCCGAVGDIGEDRAYFEVRNRENELIEKTRAPCRTPADAVKAVISWLGSNRARFTIAAIGHRLVQGGPVHRHPEIVTQELLSTLNSFFYLAPNHLPDEVQAIRSFQSAFADIPQIACFDTGFHRRMPVLTKNYPLPAVYQRKGLMRYGFHGLSYEYILQKLLAEDPLIARQKVIIAHLGNGASMAAVKNGTSVDTTMGLSPIGGLVMGTRSGDLDPGVLLFLLNQGNMPLEKLDELLSKRSGLKAIAGSGDMQELLQLEPNSPKAAAAIAAFCYYAKKFIGALAAGMGGVDLLVFTGGIGENSALIRQRICQNLDFMGITMDEISNQASREIISSQTSRVVIKMLKTDEEKMIAQHTQELLNIHQNGNSTYQYRG